MVEDMMEDYGIHRRISSVANPHANVRAEFGVKTVKRMLMDIVCQQRGYWTDPGVRSSASVEKHSGQAVSSQGSPLERSRDFLPRLESALMGDMWMNLVDARETTQACRVKHSEKKWFEYTRALAPLNVGEQ